jgi:hypothetical protein
MAGDRPVDLKTRGFWKAVAAVKRDPALVPEFADRIAVIDRAGFEQWALFTVPAAVGTALMVVATLAGLGVITLGYYIDAPWNGLALVVGTGILLVSTHGLAHLVVGRRQGMRFTHWFIGTIVRPQPGVKIDYATYLRTPARSRAWMHASGAVVTKLLPVALLGAAWGMGAPGWAWLALAAIAVVTTATDIVWSTKASDWKKYRREMRYADGA